MKKKIGIVGTHGIGKTTLAYSLGSYVKREGQNVKVINEVVRRCPFPINDGFSVRAGIWVICEQIKRELDAIKEGCAITICDRSALDPIFYMKAMKFDHALYEDLERFAITWLSSYDQLIWVFPSKTTPLTDDGVRSTVVDFQETVHNLFCEFFSKNKCFTYLSISSEDVFNNKLDGLVESLDLDVHESVLVKGN